MTSDPAFVSGALGLLGSVLLAVPAIQGLRDRRALDRELAAYRRDREATRGSADSGAADAPIPDEVPSARDVYEGNRDTILAEAIGGFWSHLFWNFAGLFCLAAAFISLMFTAS